MTTRGFDPCRLDVAAFAKEGAQLDGRWPLEQFDRLCEAAVAGSLPPDSGEVTWRVGGERRAVRGGEAQVWVHLTAATALPLECQRCLKPVGTSIAIDRSFLFVQGEDAAAQLDADSDDDVLALTRALDLRELIEDELLLALPLVPRHAVCPEPLPVRRDVDVADDAPNPFAALAALKRPGPLN